MVIGALFLQETAERWCWCGILLTILGVRLGAELVALSRPTLAQ